MITQNSEVYNPPTYLSSLYTYMEKDLCRGVVYFTVLCDHPYLVSLLFAVLVSLHPVTFLITCLNYMISQFRDIGTLCLKRYYCSVLVEIGMPSLAQPGSISHRSLATRWRLDLAYKEQLPRPKFMGL